MKDFLCGVTGFVGSVVASFFGGFDAAILTLIAFMAVDFASGLVCAGVFGASEKTKKWSTGKQYLLERYMQKGYDACIGVRCA